MPELIEDLIAEYYEWLNRNNLPHVSADELDGATLSPDQHAWLTNFQARWDASS